MISNGLYLPDYPLGHIIAFQIAAKLRDADFATEFERMARQGRLTPDAWMRGAVGEPISSKALLAEARRALENRVAVTARRAARASPLTLLQSPVRDAQGRTSRRR